MSKQLDVMDAVARAAGKSGSTANQKALSQISGKVKARIIEVNVNKGMVKPGDETSGSQTLSDDPIGNLINEGSIIEPPFDQLTLCMLGEHSTELNQCIEALETNIEGFGHRYVSRFKNGDDELDLNQDIRKAAGLERIALENFFQYVAGDDSFTKFRRKLRRDLESTGNCYFEVIRSAKNDIQGFRHIPSHHVMIGKLDDDQTLVDRPILELQPDGSVKITIIKEYKRFRRYAQSRSATYRNLTVYSGRTRWFKQFGDTRIYDCDSGILSSEKLPPQQRANEIVHMSNYCARSPYGLPRYIGNLLSIFGDRAAEEINFITFRNNNIPSMVVCVSNGQLTEGTIGRIESFVESQIQGSDNYSKFLILEAETDLTEGEDGAQVKLDIKPLVKEQHKDALFQNYSANNQDKIRRAFRLPQDFVGRSGSVTRANVDAARRLADEQIFAPERDEFDEFMNRVMFPYMGILYHKFKSNTPNTTDNSQLVNILATSEKTGGMTPRIARKILEEILGRDLGGFPEGFPADIPFSMTMAEAVKNLAQPNEPGQQLTALKMISKLTGDTADEEPTVVEACCENCGNKQMITAIEKAAGDPVVNYLTELNKRVEEKWQMNLKNAEDADASDEG
jgi:PBSX family phage portal protein